jgi:hypothetical protein
LPVKTFIKPPGSTRSQRSARRRFSERHED